MAAALQPAGGDGLRVRREALDAIIGRTEFNPQLTGRASKGTRLKRKDWRQGHVRPEENANRHGYVGHKRKSANPYSLSPKRSNRIFYEDDNEWEPDLPIPTTLFSTKINKDREMERRQQRKLVHEP